MLAQPQAREHVSLQVLSGSLCLSLVPSTEHSAQHNYSLIEMGRPSLVMQARKPRETTAYPALNMESGGQNPEV